jgi:aromatic ring-opening dioxygenase catalytic subunit (LigB family)
MLPAIFFGHGNPMNALLKNEYTDAWKRIGQTMVRPKAILSISAHWFVPETGVTIATAPRTIHDFGGFASSMETANGCLEYCSRLAAQRLASSEAIPGAHNVSVSDGRP